MSSNRSHAEDFTILRQEDGSYVPLFYYLEDLGEGPSYPQTQYFDVD